MSSSIGIELAISIFVGYYMGSKLDEYFQTNGTLTLLGILFGIAAGFKRLYVVAKKVQKDLDDHKLDDVYRDDDDKKDNGKGN